MDKETPRRSARRGLYWFASPKGLLVLFGLGLAVRLVAALFGGFQGDLDIFRAWSQRLVERGPGSFYEPGYFADYPPGYLYVLWILGRVTRLFGSDAPSNYLLKLPGILSDIGLAWVAAKIAGRAPPRAWPDRRTLRAFVAAGVLLNPAFIFLSAIWGQVDSLTAFLVLSGFLLLLTGERSLLREAGGIAVVALAFGSKPQAVFILPVVALYLVWRHVGSERASGAAGRGALELGGLALLGAVVLVALGLPFGLGPTGLVDFYRAASGNYPYTSVWAFNLWGLAGFWQPDTGADAVKVLGVPAYGFGLVLVVLGAGFILWRLWKALRRGESEVPAVLLAGAAMSLLAFALSTRMHERYLFLGTACLAPLIASRPVRRAFVGLTVLYLVNLYFPYAFYVEEYGLQSFKIDPLFTWLYGTDFDSIQKKLWSLVTGVACLFVVWAAVRWLAGKPYALLRSRTQARSARTARASRFTLHGMTRRDAWVALGIFAIVLPTRLIGLSSPPGMQFDEVYHGRAAGEYLAGKEIFEYTHPPLAKEIMALSLGAFGTPRVERGREVPPGLDEGMAATDGRQVVWATTNASGGYLARGTFGDACSVRVQSRRSLSFTPTALALTSSGLLVGGDQNGAGVVAPFVGEEEQEHVRVPAIPAAVAGITDAGFVLTDDARLLLLQDGGGFRVIDKGIDLLAADPHADRAWVGYARERTVVGYDAEGAEKASVTTAGRAEDLLVANEIPRVVIADGAAPRLEAIDPESGDWAGQLDGIPAEAIGHVPESDVVWASDHRNVWLVEALGMTTLGKAHLPDPALDFVGDLERNRLVGIGSDRLTCVSEDNAFAWRFPSAVLGSALIALVFLLCVRCFGNVLTGALAAAFLTFEGLTYVMSRVAMIDVYLVTFIVGAWLCALSALYQCGRREPRARPAAAAWLMGCGLLSGAAMASKWTGVYSLAGIVVLFVWDAFRRRENGVRGWLGRPVASLGAVAGALVVVPIGVYVLAYIPYFSLGHDLGEWFSLQANMYDYHAHLKAGHPYSSSWYEWPLGRRAVYFYAASDATTRAEIWTIANPVVLLGGLLGLAVMAVTARRRRDSALGMLPWAAVVLIAPWVLVSRELFLYHYLPMVPLLAIGLAWWVTERRARSRPSWVEVATAAGATVFVFVAVFPMLDAWYVDPRYLEQVRSWFPWVF